MVRRFLFVFSVLLILVSVTWLSMRRADIPYDTLEGLYTSETSRFMTLRDGLKVHYRDEGNREAKPLVLVHGFSASLHTWEPWVEVLKDDFRVISLDLPGHGLTRNPSPDKMNVSYFAEAVGEVAAKLGAEHYVLVGNSMGGATAWQFALSRQEMIDGLVLVAASGWQEQQVTGDRPLAFRLLSNRYVRTAIKDFDLKALIRNGLRSSFADPSLATSDMVARYAYLTRAPGHRSGILALMSGEERMPANELALRKIQVPTLIMHGDMDNVVSPMGAPKFHQAIPESELLIYKNVGHLPQEEIALKSVADLKDFLARRVWQDELPDELDLPIETASVP